MAVIDELITRYIPRMDPAAVRNVQRGFQQIQNSSKQLRADLAQVGRGMATMLGAVGVASAGVGMKVERSFTKLVTQLGATNEEVETARAKLREVSSETGVALDELANAYFSLRSGGQEAAASLDAVASAAMGTAIELGNTQDIALLVSSAVNAMAKDGLTADQVIAQLHKTVFAGQIEGAGVLAQQLPSLLEPASQLGVEFKELAAALAVFTRTQPDVAKATNAMDAAMQKLLAPGKRGQDMLEQWFGSVTDFQDLVGADFFGGLRQLLEHMQLDEGEVQVGLDVQAMLDAGEIDEDMAAQLREVDLGRLDPVMLREFFEDKTALGFMLNFAANEDAYRGVATEMPEDLEGVARAMEAVRESGWFVWVETINSLKLDLTWFYEQAIKPLLRGFNLLPDAIKRVVIAFAALQTVTMIGPFKGLSLGLWSTLMAMRATSGMSRALALRHARLGRVMLRLTKLFRGFVSVLGLTGVVGKFGLLGRHIAGLAASMFAFRGTGSYFAGIGTAIRGIATALLGIPFVGWRLAAIAALALLYWKSEGFRKLVKSVVTWVLAEVGYALEVIKGLWLDFWDLLSGMVPDWVKEVGGWFGDLLGGWFGDLFSGIDDLICPPETRPSPVLESGRVETWRGRAQWPHERT